MTMCLCFLWVFPKDVALKFDVVSVSLSGGGGGWSQGGIWGLWVSIFPTGMVVIFMCTYPKLV